MVYQHVWFCHHLLALPSPFPLRQSLRNPIGVIQNRLGEKYPLCRIQLEQLPLDLLDLLKIDVEGMEMAVLEGGDKTIRAGRPWAYVEYWNSDHAALRQWFTDQDYTVYSLPGGNILCCPNEKLAESKLDIKFPLF